MKSTATKQEADHIVDDRAFIVATRDTGYRDLTAAVAELIDNSLQAEASKIHVFIEKDDTLPEEDWAGSGIKMAVMDDGFGMGPETLRRALQFGGTNRFDDRSGFGRFGMGLPNSSVSQTRRLEVYSWQDGKKPYYTYLDVDEVASGRLRAIPTPVQQSLPSWLAGEATGNGTAVLWSRCDRLGRLRANTVAQRLHMPLGRMYRSSLWSGATIRINGTLVRPTDPLCLRGNPPFNQAVPYGKCLRFEIDSPTTGRPSLVEVQFSELPVTRWHDWSVNEKRRAGLVGGAGVSIVRAGREIDYGWHLMGGKRRENYDDWWRCEIRFSPALDELFGVTHSKQGISPRQSLKSILEPDLEHVARLLNARVRSAFLSLKDGTRTVATERASEIDRFQAVAASKIDHIDGLQYRIAIAKLPSPDFYTTSVSDDTFTVTINEDHPFYRSLYLPACGPHRERERFGLECIVLGAARADAALSSEDGGVIRATLRTSWSDTLAVLLDRHAAQ